MVSTKTTLSHDQFGFIQVMNSHFNIIKSIIQIYCVSLLSQLAINFALTNKMLLEVTCDISTQKYLIAISDTPKLSLALLIIQS